MVKLLSPYEFTIETESNTWRGDVKDGNAQAWVSLIQTLKQKAVKTASMRPKQSFYSIGEQNTRDLLTRGDFGSAEILGSIFARGYTSDLPTHDEVDAEAEARAEAALAMIGEDVDDPEALLAAIGKARKLSEQRELDDNDAFSNKKNPFCSVM